MRRLLSGIVGVAAVALAAGGPSVVPAAHAQVAPAHTPAQKRDLEHRAQAAFVAGRYTEAAQILEGLYAEFHEPLYLRNMGRSYQKLGDFDRGIGRLNDYLHEATGLGPSERDEVAGYIRQMEDARRQQAAPPPLPVAPVPAPPPPPASAVPEPLAPAAPAPAPLAATPPPAVNLATLSSAPPSPFPSRLVGGIALGAAGLLAVGGAVFLASSWSAYHDGTKEMCPLAFDCGTIADKVSSRATTSKILFGAAVVAGLAGGTLIVVGTAEHGPSVALAGRF